MAESLRWLPSIEDCEGQGGAKLEYSSSSHPEIGHLWHEKQLPAAQASSGSTFEQKSQPLCTHMSPCVTLWGHAALVPSGDQTSHLSWELANLSSYFHTACPSCPPGTPASQLDGQLQEGQIGSCAIIRLPGRTVEPSQLHHFSPPWIAGDSIPAYQPGISTDCWKFWPTWASYQMCKIESYTCAGNARNIFPATDFKGNC